MKLQYLGTAAGECVPGMFCTCPTCTRSRELGGRNIRTRFQAVIDDTVLIDFGADTYYHVIHQGLKLWEVTTCLITHDHTDHLRYEDFELRRKGIAHGDLKPLHVYGTEPTANKVKPVVEAYNLSGQNRVFFHDIRPFVPFIADGYRITPLKAQHNPKCDPVIYLIEGGGKNILMAHDTGRFPEETWTYLKQSEVKLDFISFDCTGGVEPDSGDRHMSLPVNLEVRELLIEAGIAGSFTTYVLSHFSHNGHAVYEDFVPMAEREGFIVSYDGMKLNI